MNQATEEHLEVGNETGSCRLCSGQLKTQFSKQVLLKFDVRFLECDECKSLQTEPPYWLDETYGTSLPGEDLGAVRRCQMAQQSIYFLTRLFRLGPGARVLDYGGGNGLLVRMLRDIGIDAYVFDKYEENRYAAGFEDEPERSYDMITAFEVFEHLPCPKEGLAKIFDRQPRVILGSTWPYEGQNDTWSYLCEKSGGHVFFYSEQALKLIAQEYGYKVYIVVPHILFYKGTLNGPQRLFLSAIFGRGRRLLNVTFSFFKKANLTATDNELMREKGLTRNT